MIRYRTTGRALCHFVICTMILLASCADQSDQLPDLADYYLPYGEFPPGGMRYTYTSLVDTALEAEVWEHVKTDDDRITSSNYDHLGNVVQKQFERVVDNGVLIDSLVLYYKDDSTDEQIPVNVLSPHRFPFDAVDSAQVWLTHLEWWQPGDSLHVVLERRRRFFGDTTFILNGEKLPAVLFKTHDKFETERDGWTSSEWSGEEIYVKGIGLAYYRRDISEQMKLEFKLENMERM